MSIETPDFWEQRYQEGNTRWDIGQAAPPFLSLLNSSPSLPIGRSAVLGCGRGYDALLFASYGFDVVGFDFAPSAIAAAQSQAKMAGISAEFLQRDIFDLTREFSGQFDYVIEHTCFCAIPLAQRQEYVKLVYSLLKPGGELIGLFFTHDRPGGPPFGVTLTAICEYFEREFDILLLEAATNSVSERQGEEHLGRLRRK